jgi:hypothetical protein
MTSQANIAPHAIVVTSTKSVGVQILLIVFLGPLGLFYSTIKGALTMLFGVPAAFGVLAVLTGITGARGDRAAAGALIALGSEVLLLILVWWVGSFVWGVVAVNSFNRRLFAQAHVAGRL